MDSSQFGPIAVLTLYQNRIGEGLEHAGPHGVLSLKPYKIKINLAEVVLGRGHSWLGAEAASYVRKLGKRMMRGC